MKSKISPPHRSPVCLSATTVISGCAIDLVPATVHAFDGGLLRISRIGVNDHVAYKQFSYRHLLHVTLDGKVARSAGRNGEGEWVTTPSRRGSVSFTPQGRERSGFIAHAEIFGFELGFDHSFVETACEQSLQREWKGAFNTTDARTFAIASVMGSAILNHNVDQLTIESLLLMVARQVGRVYGNDDRRRDDGWLHPAALARVVGHLQADPKHPPTLAEMARRSGLGVSAFVRAFRGSTGITPAAFARIVRLDHAAELLRSSEHSTSQIASMSGFASASHLVQEFRKRHGVTPGRWRRDIIGRKPQPIEIEM
jgi:AraC-like DNA-binding protein